MCLNNEKMELFKSLCKLNSLTTNFLEIFNHKLFKLKAKITSKCIIFVGFFKLNRVLYMRFNILLAIELF